MRPRPTIRQLVDIMLAMKCGNQCDGEKIAAKRDTVFKDYKGDVLSWKMSKTPSMRGEHGEAKIELFQGSNVHKEIHSISTAPKPTPFESFLSGISISSVGWRAACVMSGVQHYLRCQKPHLLTNPA